jgi:hypothetical protein
MLRRDPFPYFVNTPRLRFFANLGSTNVRLAKIADSRALVPNQPSGAPTETFNERQALRKISKEIVGHVLLTRSLSGDGIPRRLLQRVSPAKATSAPARF